MIARIKGLKISQATERANVTGLEMIPFQDGERNGKIRMIEFKDMTMYVFDPTITDGKISQEDYDALKKAIEEDKLIYTINADRTGLQLATEVSVDHGNIHMKSPGFKLETDSDNISLVVFDTTNIDAELNYDKSSYTTPALETAGNGNKVLTNDGSYEYIDNLALTNIKFKDDSNTSVYDLITEAITFQLDSTPCVSWSTTKNGNNIYMKLNIAKANSGMDGLLSKEDYVELNTTIPNQIEDLQNQGEELENKINQEIQDRKDEVVRLDGRINQEIADRKSEISRVDTKYQVITDNLNQSLQLEISDRKAVDNTITDNLNAFKNTKGQPGGLAELDSTGKVPAAQLPSYVDDVVEYPTLANFPAVGETGKIYVARNTNLTYRWSGNQYIEISKSLALGETSSTAYPGDKGKANRDALNSTPTNLVSSFDATTTTNELVKVNYKHVAKNGLNYSQPQNANIDIPAATESSAGAMTSIDKTRLNHLHDEFGTLKNPGDKLNTLPDNLVTEIGEVTQDALKATINYKQTNLSQDNSYSTPASRTTVIPAATSTLAGLMTSTDKTQFDRVDTANFTLNNVTTDANTASINATKTNISTGSNSANNITIPAVTASKAGVMTAADKVNLDTTIPNRITTLDNRVTTEVNNLTEKIEDSVSSLTDTMNTELAKKVGKVTVAGSGNAVTTASISGDTLTLTKGATYNNYVHPAGSAPSKTTGFYKFSTDSTSHIAGVTAVTKADITNFGIYDSATADSKYVTSLGTDGNYVTWVKNSVTNKITVPYSSKSGDADTLDGKHLSDILASNTASATKLQTARKINGTNFDGTSDITTEYWGTARNISVADHDSSHTGAVTSVNGSTNYTLKLPSTIKATLKGKADVADCLTVHDTRSEDALPSSYPTGVRFDFKANSTDSLNDGGTYHGILYFRKWSDMSGGKTTQLAFTDNSNLWIRSGVNNSWENWKKIACMPDLTWSNVSNKPTTLAGYGINDVKISNGVITIGNNTITPLTSHQTLHTLTVLKNGTKVGTYKPDSDATINISDVASATTLANHTGNKTVHITSAERTKWDKVVTDFAAITGNDSDEIINKWEEVVAFLDNYTEADTLSGLLSHKADKAVTISAGTGLTGGGNLSANRTLALATSGVTAGTYTKMTVDQYGRVTAGAALSADDVPGLPWSKITSGKPTTIAGYGITDAYTKTDSDSRYVNVTGDTMTGTSENLLSLNSTGSNSYIYFKLSNTNKASVGYYKGLACIANEVGNYARIGVNNAGIPQYWANANGNNVSTLWHSGNDGPGSGLDADLLDGVHYQNILERFYSGNSDVGSSASLGVTGWFRIAETVHTDASAISFLLFINRKYNNADNESYVFSINIAYNGGISITQLSGYANSRLITKIRVDYKNSAIAYIDFYVGTSSQRNTYHWTTVGGAKSYTSASKASLVGTAYEFTTVNGCKSDRGFTGGLAGNASSATRLQNDRTIWGQTFNGEQNVSGDMTGVGGITMSGAINLNSSSAVDRGLIITGAKKTGFIYGSSEKRGIYDYTNKKWAFAIETNGTTTLNGGNVGIGVTPSYKLDVAGTIHASDKISSPAGFWKESDVRLKSDIKPLTHTLDLICSIPTNSFIMNNTKQIGTIALELESIGFNELVSEDKVSVDSIDNKDAFEVFNENDTEYVKVKRVEYEMLSVIAIEGVKLLKDEIDKLKAEIEILKNK